MPLFLDIETTCQEPEAFMVPNAATLEPPGNYKNPETIARWREERAAELPNELRTKSSLDPLLGGTVIAVGIAVGDGPVKALVAETGDEAGERALLEQLQRGLANHANEPLVAWNGISFDFPFLAKRALRHGLHSLARRCYVAKSWGDAYHIDPFRAWQGADNRAPGKLYQVAAFLGCGTTDDLPGSAVSAAWEAGQVDRVATHVLEDVRMLRDVYAHLRLAEWIQGADEVPEPEVRPLRVAGRLVDVSP